MDYRLILVWTIVSYGSHQVLKSITFQETNLIPYDHSQLAL